MDGTKVTNWYTHYLPTKIKQSLEEDNITQTFYKFSSTMSGIQSNSMKQANKQDQFTGNRKTTDIGDSNIAIIIQGLIKNIHGK